MTKVGAIVRFLMLVACLLPFNSPRQASAALTPTPAGAPLSNTPASPDPDDDDTDGEEQTDSKEKARGTHSCSERPVGGIRLFLSFVSLTPSCRAKPNQTPVPFDHFLNGLGCPFRC